MVHFAMVALIWTLLYSCNISPARICNAKSHVFNYSNDVNKVGYVESYRGEHLKIAFWPYIFYLGLRYDFI